MNKDTQDIAKCLKVDIETAKMVQEKMMSDGFDFSECTSREFNECAQESLWLLQAAGQ